MRQKKNTHKAKCDALNMDHTDIREKIGIEKKSNRK